jgi:hypothetical protein
MRSILYMRLLDLRRRCQTALYTTWTNQRKRNKKLTKTILAAVTQLVILQVTDALCTLPTWIKNFQRRSRNKTELVQIRKKKTWSRQSGWEVYCAAMTDAKTKTLFYSFYVAISIPQTPWCRWHMPAWVSLDIIYSLAGHQVKTGIMWNEIITVHTFLVLKIYDIHVQSLYLIFQVWFLY